MKKLRITVGEKVYEVSVEILDENAPDGPARPAYVSGATVGSAPPAPIVVGSGAAAGPGEVPSPLAGKVVSIDVQAGASVSEGDQLVTIEAMKMNTYVYAPRSGKVAAILVNAGDGVEEGQALVRIE